MPPILLGIVFDTREGMGAIVGLIKTIASQNKSFCEAIVVSVANLESRNTIIRK